MENLRAPLMKKWFDMTASGEKKEDYREINAYWFSRLFSDKNIQFPTDSQILSDIIDLLRDPEQEFGIDELEKQLFIARKFKTNVMTLGYPSNTDTERILCLEHKGIEIREGNSAWGAEPGRRYFVILHGRIYQ